MPQFEQYIPQGFPHWFRGRQAGIARPLLRTLGRWSRLYPLGQHKQSAPGAPEPIAAPAKITELTAAIARTGLLGQSSDGKQIRLATLSLDSPLMHELGRLRELIFRQIGEGSGHSRDIDAFDAHYEHIVLWDPGAARIAGAYRVARGAHTIARLGLRGLYTASLFDYAEDSVVRLAEGMELGRSFVAPEYRNSRSLDYLWQGIGAYLRRHPRIRYLYGPVSISAALPLAAREQLVAYYQRYYGSGEALAVSRKPFAYFAAPPSFDELDADMAYRVLKANLDAVGAEVPTLYKQYTELCEPGGARFLAFGIDPAFSDSIDGLIEVDLHRMRTGKRQRYLDTAGACA